MKKEKRLQSHRKIRMKVFGTAKRPRLSVFKSAKHIYAQIINDETGKILLSSSDAKAKKGKKTDRAREVGKSIAAQALGKKIESVVFDRGGFVFHGRIKNVADGAREGGLKF